MRKGLKIALILLIVLTCVAGALTGVFFLVRGDDVVNVYAASDYSMLSDWVDSSEYYGEVTLSGMQRVYLSSTQQMEELFVREGDRVSEGDVLLRYDTTLSEVSLERKRLAVQKLQLQLEELKTRLNVINSYVPYVPPVVTPTPEPTPTPVVTEPEGLPALLSGSGTIEDPFRVLWPAEQAFSESYARGLLAGDSSVYAVFEIHEGDLLGAETLNEWPICFIAAGEELQFLFFDPIVPGEEEEDPGTAEPETSGFTYAEIAEMRADCQQQIKETEMGIRMAEIEYAQMQLENSGSEVLSTVNGIVSSVNLTDSAMSGAEPILCISDGEGAYVVRVSVSELDRDELFVGEEMEVYSWQTGASAIGIVTEIGNEPEVYDYGAGYETTESSVSNYTVLVSVGEEAMLSEYEYASVKPMKYEEDNAFYLERAFIKTENGTSYVWLRGEDGLLTRRNVVVGGTLWGEYIKVKSGITAEDYIAFPYGKNLREGVATVEGDWESLYGY